MPRWIEFHDSHLQYSRLDAGGAQLHLEAYVHQWEEVNGLWTGTGWYIPVRFSIGNPASGNPINEELDLDGGCLTIDNSVNDNWLPLPFSAQGQVTLWFEPRYGGRVEFAGRDVTVEIVGEARFVEKLPDHMRPSKAG
jgi:hypothetical protein